VHRIGRPPGHGLGARFADIDLNNVATGPTPFSALIAPAIPDFTKHIREQLTSAMPDLTDLNTRIFPAISMAAVMPALDAVRR